MNETGIARAISIAGSQAKLGVLLGVSQQAVAQWLKQGFVPGDRVVEIEAQTGVGRLALIAPRVVSLTDAGSGL